MALQQVTINHLNKTMQQVTDMWLVGLITDREFAKAVAGINAEYEEHPPTKDEIDPNTGLASYGRKAK